MVNDLFVSGFFLTERGFEDLQIVDKDNGVLVTGKRDMIFDFFTDFLNGNIADTLMDEDMGCKFLISPESRLNDFIFRIGEVSPSSAVHDVKITFCITAAKSMLMTVKKCFTADGFCH